MSAIIDTHVHYNLNPLFSEIINPETATLEELRVIAFNKNNSKQPKVSLDSSQNQTKNAELSWQNHWKKAQAQYVKKCIVVGTNATSSQVALDIAKQDENIFAAVAYHPGYYQIAANTPSDELLNAVISDVTALNKLLENPKVRAVGESGLDYFRLDENDTTTRKVQKVAFQAHIKLAVKHNLPLIIHVRDKTEEAYWDTLTILKEHWPAQKPFILHCVSGPTEYVKAALELGGFIGVAGNVTYKNSDHIRSLVALTPPDRIFLETDAPFLPPQEFRGKTCEPWMISLTAQYLQNELGIELEQVYENSQRVFSL